MRKVIVGRNLFWRVLSLFLLFATLFIVFQQERERRYKIDMLNIKLQDFNILMAEALQFLGDRSEKTISLWVKDNAFPNMRVSIIGLDGTLLYDNWRKDYVNISNHIDRKEIAQALSCGSGYDISRGSGTVNGNFFYSATLFESDSLIIRSALPYNENLVSILDTDRKYLWFAVFVVIVLAFVLYRFIHHLSEVINKLRLFAYRADRNDNIDIEDLMDFPANELGEISEHIIKLYKRLEKTKEEQNVLKKQLIQNIAHELKTPTASIMAYLETLRDNKEINESIKDKFLERCYAQCCRLVDLLKDISTLNRMDEGLGIIEKENIDIAQIVSQISEEINPLLKAHNMTFCNKMPSTLPFKADFRMIYSVFRNLFDNAIAYAGDGTTIALDAHFVDNTWKFVFSDNGIGVKEEHIERIFDRFYRVDKGRSRDMGGTGLGLAIVKNAILLHKGTISASNNKSTGLCITFTLPIMES